MSNTPKSIDVPGGKTFVLDNGSIAYLVQDVPADNPTRVFTASNISVYDSNAAALADIKAKGLKYVAPVAPKLPTK